MHMKVSVAPFQTTHLLYVNHKWIVQVFFIVMIQWIFNLVTCFMILAVCKPGICKKMTFAATRQFVYDMLNNTAMIS